MFWIRQHARLVFAEDPIAIARYYFVDSISEPSRKQAPDSRQTPNAAELRHHVKDRIRTRQQSFIGSLVVSNYIDGVEVMRIYSMTRHQAVCKFALKRRKSKTIVRIAFQQKLNEVVAESANAVVKNDWVGISGRQGVNWDARGPGAN